MYKIPDEGRVVLRCRVLGELRIHALRVKYPDATAASKFGENPPVCFNLDCPFVGFLSLHICACIRRFDSAPRCRCRWPRNPSNPSHRCSQARLRQSRRNIHKSTMRLRRRLDHR